LPVKPCLSPKSHEQIDSKLKPLLEKLASKKGNTERIYRNTILFLVCSEIGLSKLNNHLRDKYCLKDH
jgi:hypothetical protein